MTIRAIFTLRLSRTHECSDEALAAFVEGVEALPACLGCALNAAGPAGGERVLCTLWADAQYPAVFFASEAGLALLAGLMFSGASVTFDRFYPAVPEEAGQ